MSDVTPFDEFHAATAAATPEQYADALAEGAAFAGVTADVARAEFERMKAHILAYYEGIHPVGSYLDSNGQTVDCIPFDQQPTVRATRRAGFVATDEAPLPPHAAGELTRSASVHLHAALSPQPRCPTGAVPIVRITLERMARLGTLDNYFQKVPGK